MRHLFFSIHLLLFISLAIVAKATNIKQGYWVGVSYDKAATSVFPKIEEWYFGENTISFKKYYENGELSFLEFSGNYRVEKNQLFLINKDMDAELAVPISINGEQLILNLEEIDSELYLFYNEEKPDFKNSVLGQDLMKYVSSISHPELFYGAVEIEFWDFASFYNPFESAQCHHEYRIIEFGQHDFILFKGLAPLKIIKKEDESYLLKFISQEQKNIRFNYKQDLPLINIEDLVGKWKWRESNYKPNNINNHYTISIGYDVYMLRVQKDGFLQWFTELYYNKTQDKASHLIPNKVKDFTTNRIYREREKNESPFLRVSPSGRLVHLESYPVTTSTGRNEYCRSEMIILEYIEKSDQKILFKQFSPSPLSQQGLLTSDTIGKYITFSKIIE